MTFSLYHFLDVKMYCDGGGGGECTRLAQVSKKE